MGFTRPEAYWSWIGRWSERLAPDFVRFAGVGEGARILDVGCGTGILGHAIAASLRDVEVVGIDPAAAYVTYARTCRNDPRLSFEAGDAQAIHFDDKSFDAALSLLVLQELPDPPKAIAEMRRVTRADGIVAACQWDFRGGVPLVSYFWRAVQELHPDPAVREDAAKRQQIGIADAGALASLWSGAGLSLVETTAIEIEMAFESFEDYWSPFFSGVTPTSSYVATLPPALQAKLAETLRKKVIGDGSDRSFSLPARAWAVRGVAR